MKQTSAHCHELIRETAVEMAHTTYAELMRRNEWYDLHKKQFPGLNAKALENRWVSMHWGQHVEGARAVLASMLSDPLPDDLKDRISDALILDKALVRGRVTPSEVIGRIGR